MLETYVRVWYDVFMQKQNLKKRKLQSEYAIRKADIILIVGCLVMALLIGVFLCCITVKAVWRGFPVTELKWLP